MAKVPGIDVARYQYDVNWPVVKATGIQFAFIKATEANNYVDPYFSKNWQGAKDAGILRGAYHFFRPLVNARAQADFFLKTVKLEEHDLPPVLDLEAHNNMKAATLIPLVEIWIKAVETATGRTPILYSSPSFCNDRFQIAAGGPPLWAKNQPLWIANYLSPDATQPYLPKGWENWTFWQYSSTGKVNGIQGNVDLDWFNGTQADLLKLVGLEAVPSTSTYIVRPNESLLDIASRFNISLEDLVKSNPQLIYMGVELTIPLPDELKPAPGNEPLPKRYYVVQSGDTLTTIAVRFNSTVDAIAQANNITNINLISVGQKLEIP